MSKYFSLSWNAPNNSIINDYIIEYSKYDQEWEIYNDGISIDTTGIVGGLDTCSFYRFRVAAQNDKGKSQYSNTVSGSILSTVPDAPTNLTTSVGNQHFQLSWSAPDNGGCDIKDYIIEYYADSGTINYININTNGNDNKYILFGLINDQPYSIRVAAINAVGTGSYSLLLTGIIPAPPPPIITIVTQPSDQTALNGNATFSVTATVTKNAILSYQWQKKENNSVSFNNISGAVSSSLVLSNLTNTNDNNDEYRVIVGASNQAISITSSYAKLTVDLPVITIISQPVSQNISGCNAIFTVAASATQNATLFYQWQKQPSGSISFSDIQGATSSSLALSNLLYSENNGDTYRVIVDGSDNAESVMSSAATLTLSELAVPCPQNNSSYVYSNIDKVYFWV